MIQCIAMHENLENWCIDLTYRYKTFKYLNLHKTFLIDNMSLQNIFICQFRFSQNTFIRTFTNWGKTFQITTNLVCLHKTNLFSVLYSHKTHFFAYLWIVVKHFKLICLQKNIVCKSSQNISNYHLASSCADTTNWRGSSQFCLWSTFPSSWSATVKIVIETCAGPS